MSHILLIYGTDIYARVPIVDLTEEVTGGSSRLYVRERAILVVPELG